MALYFDWQHGCTYVQAELNIAESPQLTFSLTPSCCYPQPADQLLHEEDSCLQAQAKEDMEIDREFDESVDEDMDVT